MQKCNMCGENDRMVGQYHCKRCWDEYLRPFVAEKAAEAEALVSVEAIPALGDSLSRIAARCRSRLART